jgi:hypothetical protein
VAAPVRTLLPRRKLRLIMFGDESRPDGVFRLCLFKNAGLVGGDDGLQSVRANVSNDVDRTGASDTAPHRNLYANTHKQLLQQNSHRGKIAKVGKRRSLVKQRWRCFASFSAQLCCAKRTAWRHATTQNEQKTDIGSELIGARKRARQKHRIT